MHCSSNVDHAAGVAYIDRKTRQEVEVYGAPWWWLPPVPSRRNSKSRIWPDGMANSADRSGTIFATILTASPPEDICRSFLGQPSFPDHVADSTIAWMPRWQNLKAPHEENFIR